MQRALLEGGRLPSRSTRWVPCTLRLLCCAGTGQNASDGTVAVVAGVLIDRRVGSPEGQ